MSLQLSLSVCTRAALVAVASIVLTLNASLARAQSADSFSASTVTTAINSIAVQPDGKLLITDQSNLVRRLNADGSASASASLDTFGLAGSLLVLPDGKIIVGGTGAGFTTLAGTACVNLGRLKADLTFDGCAGADGPLTALARQPDGKILVGGTFNNLAGSARSFLGRLNADLTIDSAFAPNLDNLVTAIAVQGDGKILIAGNFFTVNSVTRVGLARLEVDGTLDTSLVDTAPDGSPLALAVQSNGKILVAGGFSTIAGASRVGIARLEANGSIDATFDPGAGPDGPITTLALQTDGKLIVGGFFSSLRGSTRNNIGRFNSDGTVDSFNPNADNGVALVALQNDGKVLAGGAFGNIGGQTRAFLARLGNDAATESLTAAGDGTSVTWLRGASSPEGAFVTFEQSTDGGANYTSLGAGVRTTGGWTLTGLTLPSGSSFKIRARAFYGDTQFIGSGSLAETILTTQLQTTPTVAGVSPTYTAAGLDRTVTIAGSGFTSGTPVVVTYGASGSESTATNVIVADDMSLTADIPGLSAGTTVKFIVKVNNVPSVASTATLTSVAVPTVTGLSTSFVAAETSTSITLSGTNFVNGATVRYGATGIESAATSVTFVSSTSLVVGVGNDIAAGSSVKFIVTVSTISSAASTATLTGAVAPAIATHPTDQTATIQADAVNTAFAAERPVTSRALAVQPDGRILFSGDYGSPAVNVVRRLNSDGSRDIDFSTAGTFSFVHVLAVQSNGRVLMAGERAFSGAQAASLARFLPDGSRDSSFSSGLSNVDIFNLAFQGDQIIVGGEFDYTANGVSRSHIARLNADGTLDTTFNPAIGNPSGFYVTALAVQGDGKILVGTNFSGLLRLNADGSRDTGFSNLFGSVQRVLVQSDGKILVAGQKPTGEWTIQRLDANGSIDTGFSDPAPNSWMRLILLSNGKILAFGAFTRIAGVEQSIVARLNADGSFDRTFPSDAATSIDWNEVHGFGRTVDNAVEAAGGIVLAPYGARLLHLTGSATAAFTVAASGTPSPTYQWQISTNGGSTWADVSNAAPYSGAAAATLGITGATENMTGYKYRVVASNTLGTALSNVVTLTVTDPTKGTIKGTVYDPANNGLAGAKVRFYKSELDPASKAPVLAGSTESTAGGAYTMKLPPGTYVASASAVGYLDRIYNNVGSTGVPVTAGTKFSLAAGATVDPVNFTFATGAFIRGTATAKSGGAISRAGITVRTTTNVVVATLVTNGSGQYESPLLSAGEYLLQVTWPPGYFGSGGGSSSVTVPASGSVDKNLVAEDVGGTITGTVTAGTTALGGAHVGLYDGLNTLLVSQPANGNGNYSFTGLDTARTYYVKVSKSGYVGQLHAGLSCLSCAIAGGTAVDFKSGLSRTVNFSLEPGATISGTVTDLLTQEKMADGTAAVVLYGAAGEELARLEVTKGAYEIGGLPAASYYIGTVAIGLNEYANTLYREPGAESVPCVSCDVTRTGSILKVSAAGSHVVNFKLSRGGSISGTVMGGGSPLPNVAIIVRTAGGAEAAPTAYTGADGTYLVRGLAAPGPYFVTTSNGGRFVDQVYNAVNCMLCRAPADGGTGVAVATGVTTGNINFTLAVGGRISGRVLKAEGAQDPLAGVTVRILNDKGRVVATATTEADGGYETSPALPAAEYFARTANIQGRVDQMYRTGATAECAGEICAAGSKISVSAGQTTTGIGFNLTAGGRIGGTVTGGGAGVIVEIFTTAGELISTVTPHSDGSYITAGGLPAGSYRARASSPTAIPRLYPDKDTCLPCSTTSGEKITLAAGETKRTVHFTLSPGGLITGGVRNLGGPIQGVTVEIYASDNQLMATGTTDFSGRYISSSGLPKAKYFARTANELGYIDQVYADATTNCLGPSAGPTSPGSGAGAPSCFPNQGKGIDVDIEQTAGPVNFILRGGLALTGTITHKTSGKPLAGISVGVYNGATGASMSRDGVSDHNGVWTVTGLAPGSYSLVAVHRDLRYAAEAYGAATCGTSCDAFGGTPQTVDTSRANLDFQLSLGGTLRGRITDSSSAAGLGAIRMEVHLGSLGIGFVTSDASGNYEVSGLAQGATVIVGGGASGYVQQFLQSPGRGIERSQDVQLEKGGTIQVLLGYSIGVSTPSVQNSFVSVVSQAVAALSSNPTNLQLQAVLRLLPSTVLASLTTSPSTATSVDDLLAALYNYLKRQIASASSVLQLQVTSLNVAAGAAGAAANTTQTVSVGNDGAISLAPGQYLIEMPRLNGLARVGAGSVEVTVTAGGQSSVTFQTQACTPPMVSPATIDVLSMGAPYSTTFAAAGGTAPHTFSLSAGSLPAGLSLDSATGVLSGTPTARGISHFTIAAIDAAGCSGTAAYAPRTYGVSLGAESAQITGAASTATVVVTAEQPSVAWTATSNASWLTTTSTGTGSGIAIWTAAANTGAARSGTITIGGNVFTVTQSPASRALIALDSPANGAAVSRTFTIAGWALDLNGTGTGVNGVHIYASPLQNGVAGSPIFVGVGQAVMRPDVADAFGSQFVQSGFTATANLPVGTYRITVLASSTVTGFFSASQTADVTVTAPGADPFMALDAPAPSSTVGASFTVHGWAVDRGASSGTGVGAVHVWAHRIVNGGFGTGTFLGAATLGLARPDVGAILGSQFAASGYSLDASGLSAGQYRIVVWVNSSVTGTFSQSRSVDIVVDVPVPNPAMALDAPAHGSTRALPLLVTGWAIDRGATSGTGVNTVHVWAFDVVNGPATFLGVASYGGTRSDVGAIFGSQFANSGYSLTVSDLPPSTYDVVIYAHSTVAGAFNQLKVVRIAVP